jgi:hypothetical protein
MELSEEKREFLSHFFIGYKLINHFLNAYRDVDPDYRYNFSGLEFTYFSSVKSLSKTMFKKYPERFTQKKYEEITTEESLVHLKRTCQDIKEGARYKLKRTCPLSKERQLVYLYKEIGVLIEKYIDKL